MNIEKKLKLAIAHRLGSNQAPGQRETTHKLQSIYKDPGDQYLRAQSKDVLLSYIAVRMPGTFAAVSSVLGELVSLVEMAPKSLIDLGSGPGTATFAALSYFNLTNAIFYEERTEFRDIALDLAKDLELSIFRNSPWHMGRIVQKTAFPEVDLAIASYSLGEMPDALAKELVESLWASAKTVIVIEPGTPRGFERIRLLREHLLGQKATIIAPCSHQLPCPMQGPDFCHFKVRHEREAFLRQAKKASLPYEDESFSYLIASKIPAKSTQSRIVKKPMVRSGHILVDLCLEGRIERKTFARSDKLIFKKMKNAKWGDAL